ncbi:uncharacterized protein BDV17DRAFT_289093 [Aspergillus undulatus]|uniref:uncharacterized protein n=1 Tax=Aspergillus undulatus TaxID=1810928 RepID=UPI003CCCBAB6
MLFNVDAVCGHVLLTCETQVDIATVTVKLSGSAVSRIKTQRLTESHLLFMTSEQLFPPGGCDGAFTSRSVTLPPGNHLFQFSIKVRFHSYFSISPAISGLSSPQQRSATSPRRPQLRTQAPHLMRKLPPSTGDGSSPEEIKYVLEATLRQDGVIRAPRRATREIYLRCRSAIDLPLHGQHAQVQRKRISYSAGHSEIKSRSLT